MATKKTKNTALENRRPQWSTSDQITLWSKCAGRCELCNRILYRNNFTLDAVKHGQFAHIIAHSEDPKAPRVDKGISKKYKDSIQNIILLCGECHKTIDNDPITYTTKKIEKIKKDFEDKIEAQTTPTFDQSRKIILFSAPIYDKEVHILKDEAISALKQTGQYPKDNPIEINLPYLFSSEKEDKYWKESKEYIDRIFIKKVERVLQDGDKIAIFGMAPQPLLAYFGYKIGEKVNKQVFQRHRDQHKAWCWPESEENWSKLEVLSPKNYDQASKNGISYIAIAINISFDISQRIKNQIPTHGLLWEVHPKNNQYSTEYVKHPEQLIEFRVLIQNLLNEVSKIAETNPIHIYSAMPVSMALTLGMSIMPKAYNPIIMHDYLKSTGLDVEALTFNI